MLRRTIGGRAFYAPDVTTYPQGGGAYPQRACVGCSFVADQVAHPAHLNARDTTLAFVSRAPQAEIQGLKERMGWELIPSYTITDDFDKDFGVDEWHGTNAFIRDGGARRFTPGECPSGQALAAAKFSVRRRADRPVLHHRRTGRSDPAG